MKDAFRTFHSWGRPRPEYIYGQRPSDGKACPEDLSSGEVADFLMQHPEVTTKSSKIRRCLAWLTQEFSGAATRRSAGPPAKGANGRP